ncbi:MAG: hypothetical protein ACYST2_04620 [Planctomycetota bacterium]|jgi:hypothetical protein
MEAVFTKTNIRDRFLQNHTGFWQMYRWFIAIFIVAIFCDALSTIHFMNRIGIEAELHPAFYLVSKIFGPNLGPMLGAAGKVMAGFAVAIYCRQYAAHIFLAASIISFWAAWYNIWGMHFYTPILLEWIP